MTLRSNLYVTEQLSWPLLGYEIIHRFAKRMLSFDSCIIDLDHGHQERQNAILFPSLILSRVYIHGVSLFYHNSNIKTDFQKEAE